MASPRPASERSTPVSALFKREAWQKSKRSHPSEESDRSGGGGGRAVITAEDYSR